MSAGPGAAAGSKCTRVDLSQRFIDGDRMSGRSFSWSTVHSWFSPFIDTLFVRFLGCHICIVRVDSIREIVTLRDYELMRIFTCAHMDLDRV